jgi:O-antigen/teichoic acid export membrane protein
LPIAALTTFWSQAIILDRVGPSLFGVVSLVATLPLLLVFADLGLGAAIVNEVATGNRDEIEAVIAMVLKTLVAVAILVAAVGVALGLLDLWNIILGVSSIEAPSLNTIMMVFVGIFSIGVPLGLGYRILVGRGQQWVVAVMQGLAGVASLGLVGIGGRDDIGWYMCVPALAQTAAAAVALALSFRGALFRASEVVKNLVKSLRHHSRRIWAQAGPMFLINMALPLGLQSDRIVLSHLSNRASLDQYSAGILVYNAAWSVIASGGMALWPHFARLRGSSADVADRHLQMVKTFSVLGVIGGCGLIVLGPIVTGAWASGIAPSTAFWICSAALLIIQAVHLPGGMILMDAAGLRFQSICIIAGALSNILIGVLLVPVMGAAGPLAASAVATLLLQAIPAIWRIRHPDLDRQAASP